MWSQSYLQRTLAIVGPERILFSIDYPYQYWPADRADPSVEKRASLSLSTKRCLRARKLERLTGTAAPRS